MAKTTKSAPGQQGSGPQGTAEPNEQKMPVEQEGGERTSSRLTFRPRVDIYETESGLMLLADVPGAKPEGLTITLERRVLSVRAEVEEHAPDGYSPIYQEYQVGDFECEFTLSGDFDPDRIEAGVSDGVLRLTIPRAEQAAARTIKITAGG
jgi:HSP20 family protein